MTYKITLYLEKRWTPTQGKYNVRLRLYDTISRKTRFVTTKFRYSETEFKSIWQTPKPRNEVKEERKKLKQLIEKAEKVAENLQPFTFDGFESAWNQKPGDKENIFFQYDATIKRLTDNRQIGTAQNYEYSKKKIIDFLKDTTGSEPEKLLFREITPAWLQNFENYMNEKGKSQTSTGIYLRPLRALLNEAISTGTISRDHYPFGRRKYEIPQTKSVKKALSREQLKMLHEATPATTEQTKAREYFFFLFNCAGLNVKDLANMKYSHLYDDKLVYIREKTKRTTKSDLKPVVVYLNQYAKDFISKHGNPDKKPENYVFPIYKDGMNEAQKFRETINFTRFLNQHIKKLAKANNLPGEISTYWSRHSFATNAIRSGASMEQMQQALNHKDPATTKRYFAGFDDSAMRGLTDNLMNF